MSVTDSSCCVPPDSEQCCYRTFDSNKGMALVSVSSQNAFPEACLVGNPWYTLYTHAPVKPDLCLISGP